MTALQFATAVVGLFSDTLAAVMNIPALSFFLLFMLFCVAYAVFRYLFNVSKTGVQ
jgi:hypothetical protein